MKRRFYLWALLLAVLVAAGCGKEGWSSGDRVLVNKSAYDLGITRPRRFDVVVFRYPRMPLEKGTPKNYIKRLLGLPGELLAIFFGRLYRCPAPADGEPPYFDDSDLDLVDRWKQPYTYSVDPLSPEAQHESPHEMTDRSKARYVEARQWFLDSLKATGNDFEVERKSPAVAMATKRRIPRFEIVRKPLDTLLAMRRIVYDNDFPAKDLDGVLPPRWTGGKGGSWGADDKHGFQNGGAGANLDWLRYRHVLRPSAWPYKGGFAWEKYTDLMGEVERETRKRFQNPEVPEDAVRAKVRQAKLEAQSQVEKEAREFAEAEYSQRVAALVAQIRRNDNEARPQLITDFLAYNVIARNGSKTFETHYPNWVGDLMLECRLKVEKAGGEFCMELSKGVDRFQACFDLQSGECTLVRIGQDGKRVPLGTKATAVKGPGEYDLRFANIDERLTVWVNRELPFEDGVPYPAPKTRGPTRNDLEPASLGSKGAAVAVHQLKLWRDTYYTVLGTNADITLSESDLFDPDKWSPPRDLVYKVLYVQPGHYLCLGDNSPQSSDSREWGTVPERLMLGRAVMVYFPFDRAGRIK